MSLLLVDLSNNNPAPDFERMAAAGVDGVYLKVSEGTWFTDQTWPGRARAARAAGLRVGGYHFARPRAGNHDAEADYFADLLGPIKRRDLRPVLDLEVGARDDCDVIEWARRFNKRLRSRTGTGPVIYSYRAYLEHLRPAEPIGYGLWLADYGADDGTNHGTKPPAPWHTVQAHQYTSKGRVAGVIGHVDLSHADKLRPLLAHPITGRLP